MSGIIFDNNTSPINLFDVNSEFSSKTSFQTSIGTNGTGALILGNASKNTTIAGNLIRTGYTPASILLNRITTNQTLAANVTSTLILNQVVSSNGITASITTGDITFSKVGYYLISAVFALQSGTANATQFITMLQNSISTNIAFSILPTASRIYPVNYTGIIGITNLSSSLIFRAFSANTYSLTTTVSTGATVSLSQVKIQEIF